MLCAVVFSEAFGATRLKAYVRVIRSASSAAAAGWQLLDVEATPVIPMMLRSAP